jgi:hypothetical protein
MGLAMVRRFLTNLVPQAYHLVGQDGQEYATMHQRFNPLVFKLDVEVAADCPVDRRLVLAAAVLLAAVEGRQG